MSIPDRRVRVKRHFRPDCFSLLFRRVGLPLRPFPVSAATALAARPQPRAPCHRNPTKLTKLRLVSISQRSRRLVVLLERMRVVLQASNRPGMFMLQLLPPLGVPVLIGVEATPVDGATFPPLTPFTE
jgi:hypothetical protein